jgi:hypothetical protein
MEERELVSADEFLARHLSGRELARERRELRQLI